MPSSEFTTTTTAELAERIDRAHGRFAALLREVPDDTVVDRTWTAGQVVGHLTSVVNRYTAFAPERLGATPRAVDAINAREVEEWSGRPLADALDALDGEMDAFRRLWGPEGGIPLDQPVPFHAGGTIDVQAALTNLLGEYLVHGLDVADAVGVAWDIDARDGALLATFGTQVLPFYAKPDAPPLVVRFDLEGMEPWVLSVDGSNTSTRPPQPGDDPDVVLQGPAGLVPLLFYGRLDLAGAETRGLRVAGGTHPERAVTLTDRFESP